jgi:nitrous oxidase accessory protein NosD
VVATNSGNGITVAYSSHARIERCALTDNGAGVFMFADDIQPGTAYVSDTLISGNQVGLKYQSGPPGKIYSFRNNRLVANATDGSFTDTLNNQ